MKEGNAAWQALDDTEDEETASVPREHSIRMRNWRAIRKSLGQCICCKNPHAPNRTRCEKHLAMLRASDKKRRSPHG